MNTAATRIDLRCPKCNGDLVVYERQGIVVDQCRECRGVWLDRGELEHLIDMEAEYVRRMSKPDGASRPDGDAPRRDDPRDARRRDDDRYDDRYDARDRDDRSGGRRRDDDRDDRDEDGRRRGGDRRGNLFGDIFGDILGG